MKSGAKMLVSVLGAIAVCTTARAATENAVLPEENDTSTESAKPNLPYEEIVARNVFALKPPPPPPSPEETKPPPSKILLTGITTIMGKMALMKTPPPPATKPGEPAKGERFYALRVGEQDGEIEVLDIDEKAGSVRVKNSGVEELLTFEKNGVKLAATPAPGTPGVPGALPGVGGARLPFGAVPPPVNPNVPGTMPAFPSRTIRSITPSTGQQPGAIAPGYTTTAPTFTPTPGFAPTYTTARPQQPPQPQLTAEEATVLVEIERQRLINKGNPNAMVMPPTVLSRESGPMPPAPQ